MIGAGRIEKFAGRAVELGALWKWPTWRLTRQCVQAAQNGVIALARQVLDASETAWSCVAAMMPQSISAA